MEVGRNEPVLSAEHLSFSYDGHQMLFRDVTFFLGRGEILQILGANGAGKSTLMGCLTGQLRPRSGCVRLLGDAVSALRQNELARRMAYVPQLQGGGSGFRVRDYVVMGRAPYLGIFEAPLASDYELADRALEELGIARLAEQSMLHLSGGERQQARIARALVQGSGVLCLDEPTNHLDFGNQYRVLELLQALVARGYTVVLTTHMPDFPLLTGGKVGVFLEGQFQFGQAEELLGDELVNRLYGVDARVVTIAEIGRKACLFRQNGSGSQREEISEIHREQTDEKGSKT